MMPDDFQSVVADMKYVKGRSEMVSYLRRISSSSALTASEIKEIEELAHTRYLEFSSRFDEVYLTLSRLKKNNDPQIDSLEMQESIKNLLVLFNQLNDEKKTHFLINHRVLYLTADTPDLLHQFINSIKKMPASYKERVYGNFLQEVADKWSWGASTEDLFYVVKFIEVSSQNIEHLMRDYLYSSSYSENYLWFDPDVYRHKEDKAVESLSQFIKILSLSPSADGHIKKILHYREPGLRSSRERYLYDRHILDQLPDEAVLNMLDTFKRDNSGVVFLAVFPSVYYSYLRFGKNVGYYDSDNLFTDLCCKNNPEILDSVFVAFNSLSVEQKFKILSYCPKVLITESSDDHEDCVYAEEIDGESPLQTILDKNPTVMPRLISAIESLPIHYQAKIWEKEIPNMAKYPDNVKRDYFLFKLKQKVEQFKVKTEEKYQQAYKEAEALYRELLTDRNETNCQNWVIKIKKAKQDTTLTQHRGIKDILVGLLVLPYTLYKLYKGTFFQEPITRTDTAVILDELLFQNNK